MNSSQHLYGSASRSREPPPRPDQPPDHEEDDQDTGKDAKTIARDFAGARGRVEEVVDVEALRRVRQVRETQVQQ